MGTSEMHGIALTSDTRAGSSPWIASEIVFLTAVAAATLNADGTLLEANAGFLRIFEADRAMKIGAQAAPFFIQPSFLSLSRSVADPTGVIYRGLLNLGNFTGTTRTLRGVVWRRESTLCVMAEHNVEELEHLSSTVLELNREYAKAQSDLAQANIRLRQREAKLQLAANVFLFAREGISITDSHGTIVDVNGAFTDITGYSREDAIGQNHRMLSSGRQDAAFYTAMWDTLSKKGHWSGEVWNRRKSGETYAELLTISSVRDAQSKVQQYVALFSDITSIKSHESDLEHIAHFDALTRLPNRLLLADRLKQAMTQAQRRDKQVAVAYLDLDGFKSVNDRYGHSAGDQLLIALSNAMKDTLREGDTLARIGGDEFVAVLIDVKDTESCMPMLNRLIQAAASSVQLGNVNVQISASLGVSFYPQSEDIDADQLMRQADQAMYQAKGAGKNRCHVFDEAQTAE